MAAAAHAGAMAYHQAAAGVLALRKADGRTIKETPGSFNQTTIWSQNASGLLAQGSTARSTWLNGVGSEEELRRTRFIWPAWQAARLQVLKGAQQDDAKQISTDLPSWPLGRAGLEAF
jgi:hypothetical protein